MSAPCKVCASPGHAAVWGLWVCNQCFSAWFAGCPHPVEEDERKPLPEVEVGWTRVTKEFFRKRYTELKTKENA